MLGGFYLEEQLFYLRAERFPTGRREDQDIGSRGLQLQGMSTIHYMLVGILCGSCSEACWWICWYYNFGRIGYQWDSTFVEVVSCTLTFNEEDLGVLHMCFQSSSSSRSASILLCRLRMYGRVGVKGCNVKEIILRDKICISKFLFWIWNWTSSTDPYDFYILLLYYI